MNELSWESCNGWKECLAWVLIQPFVTVLLIPFIAVVFGGLVKWVLAQTRPIRDYFLVGSELAVTALAMSFTNIFDWARKALASPNNLDFPPLLFSVAVALLSVTALLLAIALMGAYINKSAGKGIPSINWGPFWAINLFGGVPLGLSALLLIG